MAAPYPAQTAASLAASPTHRAAARAAWPCARKPRRCRASTRQSPLPMAADLAWQRSARSDCRRDRPKHSTPRYSTGLAGCANCRRAARCPHPATPVGWSAEEGGGLCKWRPRAAGRAHWRSRMRDLSTTTSARFRCNSASCGDAAAWQHGTGDGDAMHNWRTSSCRRGG